MNSRYILLLVFCTMGSGAFAQTGKKKAPVKITKAGTKKKVITESEAKKRHEDQLAKEGKQNERRAYKRTDFDVASNTDGVVVDGAGATHSEVVLSTQTKAAPVQTVPNTAKPAYSADRAAPATPKFIETIVLERKEG